MSGEFGDHFWAEFYLPGDGWIPADTSIAQLSSYTAGLSDQERREFVDYYFGNLDPMRCTVQLDVDEPLTPPADGMVALPMVVQSPTGLCSTMTDDIPGALLTRDWKIECEPVSGK